MLDLIRTRPLSAGEIGLHFSHLTQPGVSKHLGVLRKAKLVSVEVEAQRRVYSLEREGFMELDSWISKYERFWADKLDSLGEFLEREYPGGRQVKRK